jgi:hypothetical protein
MFEYRPSEAVRGAAALCDRNLEQFSNSRAAECAAGGFARMVPTSACLSAIRSTIQRSAGNFAPAERCVTY